MDTGDTQMQDTKGQASLKVLEITASGRNDGSVSRMLSADLVGALEERHGSIELTRRDLSRGLALVDESSRICKGIGRPTPGPAAVFDDVDIGGADRNRYRIRPDG